MTEEIKRPPGGTWPSSGAAEPVPARGRPRPRHGLVGRSTATCQPGRTAHRADHRRVQRVSARRRRRPRPRSTGPTCRPATRLCHAVRDWALANPHEYALTFGSPVPGYVAPPDTIEPGSRVSLALLRIVVDGVAAGIVRPPPGRLAGPAGARRRWPRSPTGPRPGSRRRCMARGMIAWTQLFGAVSFEVFGRLDSIIADREAWFDHQVLAMARTCRTAPLGSRCHDAAPEVTSARRPPTGWPTWRPCSAPTRPPRGCYCMWFIVPAKECRAGWGGGNRTAFEELPPSADPWACWPTATASRSAGARGPALAVRSGPAIAGPPPHEPPRTTRVAGALLLRPRATRRTGVTRRCSRRLSTLARDAGATAVEGFPLAGDGGAAGEAYRRRRAAVRGLRLRRLAVPSRSRRAVTAPPPPAPPVSVTPTRDFTEKGSVSRRRRSGRGRGARPGRWRPPRC